MPCATTLAIAVSALRRTAWRAPRSSGPPPPARWASPSWVPELPAPPEQGGAAHEALLGAPHRRPYHILRLKLKVLGLDLA